LIRIWTNLEKFYHFLPQTTTLLISFWISKLDFPLLTKDYLQNQELRRFEALKSTKPIYTILVKFSIKLLITNILQVVKA